jgi:predicted transcriptional regulator
MIHENLAALSKVIRGVSLITNEIQEYAKDLLQNEVIQKNSLGTYYVIHGLDFS